MGGNPNEVYTREEREEMVDKLRDDESILQSAEAHGHYAVNDGYCACGAFCETGTRLRAHQRDVVSSFEIDLP